MKSYTVQFYLWDITQGERTGELIEESESAVVQPMQAVLDAFDAYAADCPVALKPFTLGSVRVGLSRSKSGRWIGRRRFDFEGSKYMLAMHVEGPPRAWQFKHEGCTFDVTVGSDGQPIVYSVGAGAPVGVHVHPIRNES